MKDIIITMLRYSQTTSLKRLSKLREPSPTHLFFFIAQSNEAFSLTSFFFSGLISQLLKLRYNCEDHILISFVFPQFTIHLTLFSFLLGKSDQFKKYSHGTVDTLKIKYDYMSIMHYGKDYFAKLDSERRHYMTTIKTKDSRYQNKIGQRQYLTRSDILMINTMYGCPGN